MNNYIVCPHCGKTGSAPEYMEVVCDDCEFAEAEKNAMAIEEYEHESDYAVGENEYSHRDIEGSMF